MLGNCKTLFLKKNAACGFSTKYAVLCYSMMDKFPTINPKPDPLDLDENPVRKKRSSNAMRAYVENVKIYNKFMEEQRTEFEIGKRHLANMMGKDPDNFTQEEVDESIEYLFPCGLYMKSARPMMKPPDEIFPSKKEAEFDETGRPFHFLFYTLKPQFYQILHDAVKCLRELNAFEDRVQFGQERKPDLQPFDLLSTTWPTKEQLEQKLFERITDDEYRSFVSVMDRITEHPYSEKAVDFLFKNRIQLASKLNEFTPIPVETLEDGRKRVTALNVPRKYSRADVTVTYPGTGKILIGGKDIKYFRTFTARDQNENYMKIRAGIVEDPKHSFYA